MPFVCLGGGGEGFFTDRKIALSSPSPFVPDEKERALSLEKARLAQGLANGSPRPLPFPLPSPKTITPLISGTVSATRKRKRRKSGEGRVLSTNTVPMFSDIRTKRKVFHTRKNLYGEDVLTRLC